MTGPLRHARRLGAAHKPKRPGHTLAAIGAQLLSAIGIDKRLPTLHAHASGLVGATVKGLLLTCRPSHIAGFVVAVVVGVAVQGMTVTWPRPHINEEVTEVKPTLADRNATPTIVLKMNGVAVKASLFHSVPDSVLRSADQSVLQPFLNAATASRVPSLQLVAGCDELAAAMALALVEIRAPTVLVRYLKDFDAIKNRTAHVDVCWHLHSVAQNQGVE
jgi:hypothetical protein